MDLRFGNLPTCDQMPIIRAILSNTRGTIPCKTNATYTRSKNNKAPENGLSVALHDRASYETLVFGYRAPVTGA